MPETCRAAYTAEEQKRYGAVYTRLLTRMSSMPSAAPARKSFGEELEEELAAGFPIDFPDAGGRTLLRAAADSAAGVNTDVAKALIKAGADVDAGDRSGRTPLGAACWWYVCCEPQGQIAAIDEMLAGRRDAAGTKNAQRGSLNAPTGRRRSVAGAAPVLDETWKEYRWPRLEQRARRNWLAAYLAAWDERRAAAEGREGSATPAFDYAL